MRPVFAPLLSRITGLPEAEIHIRQIRRDPFQPGNLLMDGQSIPLQDLNLVARRRPADWNGVYQSAWLYLRVETDERQAALIDVCQCGRKRLWVDDRCCELRPPSC